MPRLCTFFELVLAAKTNVTLKFKAVDTTVCKASFIKIFTYLPFLSTVMLAAQNIGI